MQVCRQGLVFGEAGAGHVGEVALNDPVIHIYFLLYVLGAIDWFGDQIATAEPLSDAEKNRAMAEALAAFQSANPEEIRETVVRLRSACGPAALRVLATGRRDAAQSKLGDASKAEHGFAQLMAQDGALQRPLEPALRLLLESPTAPSE